MKTPLITFRGFFVIFGVFFAFFAFFVTRIFFFRGFLTFDNRELLKVSLFQKWKNTFSQSADTSLIPPRFFFALELVAPNLDTREGSRLALTRRHAQATRTRARPPATRTHERRPTFCMIFL